MARNGDALARQKLGLLDFGAYCDTLSGLYLTSTHIRTENSTVFKAVVPSSGRLFAVKQVASVDQAELEYQSLRRLFCVLPKQARVAEPICLIPEHAVVVSEWIEGRSVKAWLQDSEASFDGVCKVLAAAGRWLRQFHFVQSLGEAELELQKKLAQLDDLCEAHAATPWRHALLKWMRQRLVATSRQFAGEFFRVSDLHGDFKPENLLVEGERLVGIDIGHIYRSCVWNDVAYFLVQLDWAIFSNFNLRFIVARRKLRRCFLVAYQPEGIEKAANLLPWLEQEVLFRFAHKHLDHARFGLRKLAALAIVLPLFISHGRQIQRAGATGAAT
jgi:hypothetical protein